jgi:flagellar basal body-associated protein FliL
LAVANSQNTLKKRSKRFYFVLMSAVVLLSIVVGTVVFIFFFSNANYEPGLVDIKVTPEKPSYMQGETVRFTIYVNNQQDRPIRYPTLVDYLIEKDGLYIYDQGEYGDYPAGQIPAFPAHSESLVTWTWNQNMVLADDVVVQVQPGNYTLTVSFRPLEDYGAGGSCTFEIQ